MTNKQRVHAAIAHQQPDRVPYAVGFTHGVYEQMSAYYGDPDFASKLGNCLAGMGFGLPGQLVDGNPGFWRDEFGVVWNRTVDSDIGVVEHFIVNRRNLPDYVLPDPNDPRRFQPWNEIIAKNPDQFLLADLGFSLFERAWTLAGMENLLMAMVDDKPFAHGLLDRILEFNLACVNEAVKYPVDAVCFGDDWGQQRGLIMGPVLWREFIKPRIRQMYDAVHRGGKRVFIHSCGDVKTVFAEIIEAGVDVFNPFQPEVMEPFEMKRLYGDRVSFYGGISIQRLLPFGTPKQVREEVRALLDRVGKNGGYIAAPSHSIPRGVPPENIAAMIDVLQNQ